MNRMKPDTYREIRQSLGTQKEVAELLGVHKMTVWRRESGAKQITREAAQAITHPAMTHHLPGESRWLTRR